MAKLRPLAPIINRALDLVWLMEYIHGKPVSHMVRETGHSHHTITRHMKKAAALLVDAAQESILQEIFPLATQVLKAHLNQQLARAKEGKDIDMAQVERIMKGMYVFDSPQLKDSIIRGNKGMGDGDDEGDTLVALVARRPAAQLKAADRLQKVIDSTSVTTDKDVVNGNNHETDALPEGGPSPLALHLGARGGQIHGNDEGERPGVGGEGLKREDGRIGSKEADGTGGSTGEDSTRDHQITPTAGE